MKGMEPLGDALKKRMSHFHLNQTLTASAIVEAANRVLPQDYRAKTFRNHTLTIETPSGALAYLFKQDYETYLERVNAALDEPIVHKFFVRITHTTE